MSNLPAGLTVGPVSEGTLKIEDLTKAALGVLKLLDYRLGRQFEEFGLTDETVEDENETYEDIVAAIDAKLPVGYFYGPAEGDGACIGIWLTDELFEEDGSNS
jgi:hypothetical protein